MPPLFSCALTNLVVRSRFKETNILVRANNHSTPRLDQHWMAGVCQCGHFDESFIDHNLRITARSDSHAEFSSAHIDRSGLGINAVMISSPAEMIDSHAHTAHSNFQEFTQ